MELVGHQSCLNFCLPCLFCFGLLMLQGGMGNSQKDIYSLWPVFQSNLSWLCTDTQWKHLDKMTSQADSSSSASFQATNTWATLHFYVPALPRLNVRGDVGKYWTKNNFKHGIYPRFPFEAGRLSSGVFHRMYRVRSPRWFAICLQGREGLER